MDIQSLQRQLDQFAREREWEKFHSIRNLILALISEVGELAETVQWSDSITFDALQSDKEKKKLIQEELADIFIYLIRIADLAQIDILEAAQRKINKNAQRYSIEKSKGNSIKQPK